MKGDRIFAVSRGTAVPGRLHRPPEEGGQPRRGVWCPVTFPELFYPLLAGSCAQQQCPSLGSGGWEHSQRCLLESLPGAGDAATYLPWVPGTEITPARLAGASPRGLEEGQGEHRDPRGLPAPGAARGAPGLQPLPALHFHLGGKPGPGSWGDPGSSAWLNPI